MELIESGNNSGLDYEKYIKNFTPQKNPRKLSVDDAQP